MLRLNACHFFPFLSHLLFPDSLFSSPSTFTRQLAFTSRRRKLPLNFEFEEYVAVLQIPMLNWNFADPKPTPHRHFISSPCVAHYNFADFRGRGIRGGPWDPFKKHLFSKNNIHHHGEMYLLLRDVPGGEYSLPFTILPPGVLPKHDSQTDKQPSRPMD